MLGKKYDDAWYLFLQVKVGPAALVVTNVVGNFRDGQGGCYWVGMVGKWLGQRMCS